MTKASLLNFLVQPSDVVRGIRRLGGKGAVLHGVRRASAVLERAFLGPAQLRINPMGAVCNHTCPMCWLQVLDAGERKRLFREDREHGMALEDYERLFAGIPPGLTEVNVVGGGEPLLHPACVQIMQVVKRRKLRGYLITNGTLLDERVATAMIHLSWDLTRVSTHAGDGETYAKVQGVDHFECLRENLKTYDRLRRAAGKEGSCALHVHHVLQRENLETIPEMFAFSEEVGADRTVFEIVFPIVPSMRLTADELERTRDVLGACARDARSSSNAVEIVASLGRESVETRADEQARAQAQTTAERVGEAPSAAPGALAEEAVVQVPDAPYRPANRCSVGFDSAFVTALGDVLPCCFSNEVMGNVRESRFREIWFGEQYTAFRKRLINGCFADYCSNVRCKLTSFLHD